MMTRVRIDITVTEETNKRMRRHIATGVIITRIEMKTKMMTIITIDIIGDIMRIARELTGTSTVMKRDRVGIAIMIVMRNSIIQGTREGGNNGMMIQTMIRRVKRKREVMTEDIGGTLMTITPDTTAEMTTKKKERNPLKTQKPVLLIIGDRSSKQRYPRRKCWVIRDFPVRTMRQLFLHGEPTS